jgi:ATP-dependent helicase HrpB
MSLKEQKRVLSNHDKSERRIILATNVAESSVTVPDVSVVVDSGLERVGSWSDEYRLPELHLRRISLANHKQRAGRAARLGPGQAYLAWVKADELSMKADITPEVLVSDLRSTILMILSFKNIQLGAFAWLTSPRGNTLDLALQDLKQKNLISEDQKLTDLGKLVAALPYDLDSSYLIALLSKGPKSDLLVILGLIVTEGRSLFNLQYRRIDFDQNSQVNHLLDDLEILINNEQLRGQFQKVLMQVRRILSWSTANFNLMDQLKEVYRDLGQLRLSFIDSFLRAYPFRLGLIRAKHPNRVLLSNGKGGILKLDNAIRPTDLLIVLDAGLIEGEAQIRKIVSVTLEELLSLPEDLFTVSEAQVPSQKKNPPSFYDKPISKKSC